MSERSLREVALDYLARREHTRVELERKLVMKGYDQADIVAVLDRLESQNLQSDYRFASHFLDQRARSGSGPQKIKMELEQHGIASQVSEAIFQEASVEWSELAKEVWQRKFPEPATDMKEKARRQRFMLQRGFSYEHFKQLNDSD